MTRTLRALLLLLLAGLVLGPAQVAVAHDSLVGTTPSDGSTVQAAPESLTLTFTGAIATVGAQVVVRAAGGAGDDLVDGPPQISGAEVVQPLAPLEPGAYDVLWRVTSQDGHPISGELLFTVAGTGGDASTEPTASAEDTATPEVTVTAEATTTGATGAATTETAPATTPATTTTATAGDGDGIPRWAWLVLGLAVLGLLMLLGTTWSRRRR
ncbi:copper resistance protein CopC [Ornithinimicrobium sp. LYQ121]|uniref:copper resistance CopC family protein n=1 Tax=Ornithinimicrobium sp. LYQ121 TaxID=3378801 RepID=UPI00385190C1